MWISSASTRRDSGISQSSYHSSVGSQNPSRRSRKEPPLGETGQESLYLRFLSDKQVKVNVKLRDGENVSGWIEYFDDTMIRLTREGLPNLFIYKHQIRTISERGRRFPGVEPSAS
ncbi:MAG TPA: RNA chaperone Hfq [Acidobacteriaceae bacterium]|nr:RNA chaperone Hfq [Acidobacteriaceae bacterium]